MVGMRRWYGKVASGLLLAAWVVGASGVGLAFELVDGRFAEPLAVRVRCGTLIRILISQAAVPWLDLERLLRDGNFQPEEANPAAAGERQPASESAFVILTFEVEKGLSLGRYDYKLLVGDGSYAALAITPGQRPYDPRVWEFVARDNKEDVSMLFEIALPATPTTGLLRAQMDGVLADEPVRLPIGREKAAPLPEPAPEPMAATDDGEQPPAPDEAAPEAVAEPAPVPEPVAPAPAAVAEPAPKPAPEAKPTPEVKPAPKPAPKPGPSLDDLW